MFATLQRCRLYYDVSGDGPPLVLIRGLARSSSHWGPVLPLLARFRCVVLDNRGAGRSGATWPPYTTRQLADDVAAVMDAARIERAHVFGMSLGGMIAQEFALAHGDRVDRLILGCTTPGGRRARPTLPAARRAMLAAAFGRHDPLFALLANDAAVRDHRAWWLELARREPLPLRGLVGQLAAVLRHDTLDRLAAIAHRTLVITGDDDAIIPAANSRLIAAAIPNAILTVLPGARHDFTTDRPHESARAIEEFLVSER